MMVKPFEEAVFKLGQNEMQVVESEFGFHVVRVTGIQAAKARPYEEVQKELAEELARQKGRASSPRRPRTSATWSTSSRTASSRAAERFKLQVQTTGWIAKSARQELGALDNPKLLSALFSSDAIKNKRNTDAIEVAPNTLVAARVLEHQPAAQRSFDEVKGEIAQMLRQREASALALKDGQAKLEQLRKGEDAGVKWSAPRTCRGAMRRACRPTCCARWCRPTRASCPPMSGCRFPTAATCCCASPRWSTSRSRKTIRRVAARSPACSTARRSTRPCVDSLRSRADIEINPANLERRSSAGTPATTWLNPAST